MKKIALTIMAFVVAFSSIAQTNDTNPFKQKELHHGKKHFKDNEKLDKLNLKDDQKARIKTLNESYRQQMQNLNKNKSISAAGQKEKRKALAKEHREKIASILTPEQTEQAKNMRHDSPEKHKGEMHTERFDQMTKDLNLTTEQSAKMKDLNSAFIAKLQSLRQNTAISDQEKKEQMKNLMKKHKADMEALLTNEQKEQLKNNHENRRLEAVK